MSLSLEKPDARKWAERIKSADAESRSTSKDGNALRILVVDDNPAIHEDFRKIFRANEGNEVIEAFESELFGDAPKLSPHNQFEIDSAHQGKEGLQRVEEAFARGNPYPMAFVDVRMPPGWDGIETVARIWEKHPDIQIVICTAYSDYSPDEMLQKLGQSDRLVILKKPFDNVEVLQLAGMLTEKWSLLQKTRTHMRELEERVAQKTEEWRKSEERFRLIMENAVDLIAIVNPEGQRLYSSPSYERLLDYSAEEFQAGSPLERVHPEDRNAVLATIQDTMRSGVGVVTEYRIQHRDGSWRTLESHGSPFRNRSGRIEGVLMVARDITERKSLELQLRTAQKLESIGQLAAGIAHEINTPTQFIGDNIRFVRDAFIDLQGFFTASARLLEAARRQAVTPELIGEVEAARAAADTDYLLEEVPKAIGQSIEGVDRVAKIVRAMKEFSHPGTESKTLLDLNHAIESTLTICHSEWKYVADLVADLDPTLPLVPVLPGEFNQVILNLVINAAHAIADVMGDGAKGRGTLMVSTRAMADSVEVRIRDTGTGIPEKIRERIFEPFFTTKGVGKGTGQGLAIARSVVVDKHGGTIHFETETGKGTCFVIRLPRANNTNQEKDV